MQDHDRYIPGVCNIGQEEIRLRKSNAIFMGVLCIVLVVAFLYFEVDKAWRLLLFFPVTGLAVGIQQWRMRFCVYFGMKGLFNFGSTDSRDSVMEAELRKQDRAKAMRMIAVSIISGLVLAIAFYLYR